LSALSFNPEPAATVPSTRERLVRAVGVASRLNDLTRRAEGITVV
jgi:hypothetical protein